MSKMLTRLIQAAIAVACLLSSAAQAQMPEEPRALTVEDIVSLESFGRAAISPDGRWAVYEKRGAYDSIERFQFAHRSTWTIMDLWLVDLARPATPPRRLLPGEGPGLQRVAFSPSGARLLISRMRDETYEFGVVSMSDGSVQWTGLTPETPRRGAAAQWVSDDRVVLMVRPDHSLPATLRLDGGGPPRTAEAWERTALGREASRTIIDGRSGVVSTETPAPPGALVMLDLATGERSTLASGRITDFSISPDGRQAAIVSSGEGAPLSAGPLIQGDNADRQRLSVVGLDSGSVARPMDDRDIAPHLLRWSADSRAVLVWARPDGAAWTGGGLAQVTAEGVVMTDISGLTPGSDKEIVAGVRADWIGGAPVLYARPQDGGRFDWRLFSPGGPPQVLTASLTVVPNRIAMAGPDAVQIFADGGLWSASAAGLRRVTSDDLTVRQATVGDQEQVTRLASNEAPRQTWTVATDQEGEHLVLTGEGGERRLGSGSGTDVRVLATSPVATLVVDRTGVSESLHLRTAAGDERLDGVNMDLTDVTLIEPVPVPHLDHQGRPTLSWLFLPAGARTGDVRGLIVRIYPGSTDSLVWYDPLNLMTGVRSQVLAAAGFAVLSPSIPGDAPAEGRGEVFLRSVDLAVDAALAAHPELPGDRMAIFGHSFGGYAALQIAARSTRYRSYIASSALSDLSGFWGELHPGTRIQPEDGALFRAAQGWTEVGQGGMGAPPWVAADAYAAASPYLLTDRITAPVLLLTADMDFTPMNQAERVFSARLRQGGRVRLITYWGEHHTFWSPANIRDRYNQIFDWLDETLAPDEISPPAPADAPRPATIPRTPPPP